MRPRIRTVKPEMRHDERYARLSYPARELFNGLITMGDDEGRFLALSSVILGHVFPYDKAVDLRDWVAEVKGSQMILFYVADSVPYGAFRHWAKHQRINRPTPSDLPPPPSPKVVRENAVVKTDSGWRQAFTLKEDSVSSHGALSESSVSPHSPRAGARSDPFPSVVSQLCEDLATRVRANDPKATPQPQSHRWLNDMRLLLADRNGDAAEVGRVLAWSQADPFWHSNILSPGKLRKQFTQLVLKASPSGQVVSISRRENASDMLNALRGEAS